jgi:hypothetical protein
VRQRKADQDGEGISIGDFEGSPSHLYVNVKAAIFSTPDPVQIVFSLWAKSDSVAGKKVRSSVSGGSSSAGPTPTDVGGGGGEAAIADEFTQISEEFLVGLTNKGFPEDPELFDKLCTLFLDTPRAVIREHLFLVCRIYRIGSLNPDPKAKVNLAAGAKSIGDVADTAVIFRRPFGVGVMDLANLDVHQFEHGKEGAILSKNQIHSFLIKIIII